MYDVIVTFRYLQLCLFLTSPASVSCDRSFCYSKRPSSQKDSLQRPLRAASVTPARAVSAQLHAPQYKSYYGESLTHEY